MNHGALQSSGAQFRAERPKSGNLSTIPKRSLNADLAQWVANGGVVTVVQVQDVRVKPDVPLNLTDHARRRVK